MPSFAFSIQGVVLVAYYQSTSSSPSLKRVDALQLVHRIAAQPMRDQWRTRSMPVVGSSEFQACLDQIAYDFQILDASLSGGLEQPTVKAKNIEMNTMSSVQAR